MNLIFPSRRDDTSNIIRRVNAMLSTSYWSRQSGKIITVGPGAVQLQLTHAVHDFPVGSLGSGLNLGNLPSSAVRYIVKISEGLHAAVDVPNPAGVAPGAAPSARMQINVGPFVESSIKAFHLLANSALIAGNSSYEVRCLRCAPLQVLAIWLKSTTDGADHVVPLSPSPREFEAFTPYSALNFTGVLNVVKQRRALPPTTRRTGN